MNKIYFKGLNGIRAIAAFIVITFHIDQFMRLFGVKAIGYHHTGMAGFGVTLFFVLSGYLITYLLLTEKKDYQRVDLKKFYTRRILRIWPIYYLIILLTVLLIVGGIMIIPGNTLSTDLLLYLFLVPNLGIAFGSGIINLVPLWSVGVEEQFYAFWPLLLNKAKNILLCLLYVVIVYLAVKICLRVFENGRFYSVISASTFDSMAFGGMMAYFVFNKNKVLSVFYHPVVQAISWLFLIVSVFYKPVHIFSIFDSEIHSVFYAIIIVNVSTNPKTLVNLEYKLLNFIGRISYGLYVYHMTIIWLLSLLLKNYIHLVPAGFAQYLIIYSLVYVVTILVAFLSYTYFESFFLKKKARFSQVYSTN